jgi:hypothetical protein
MNMIIYFVWAFSFSRYQGAKKKPTPNILNFYLKSEFLKKKFNEIYSLCVLNIFDLILMVSEKNSNC